MVVIDVSYDRRFKLVCDENLQNPHYEEHDGRGPVFSDLVEPFLLKQYHFAAAQIRDEALKDRGILPFQIPSPRIWERLPDGKRIAFPHFTPPLRVAA